MEQAIHILCQRICLCSTLTALESRYLLRRCWSHLNHHSSNVSDNGCWVSLFLVSEVSQSSKKKKPLLYFFPDFFFLSLYYSSTVLPVQCVYCGPGEGYLQSPSRPLASQKQQKSLLQDCCGCNLQCATRCPAFTTHLGIKQVPMPPGVKCFPVTRECFAWQPGLARHSSDGLLPGFAAWS